MQNPRSGFGWAVIGVSGAGILLCALVGIVLGSGAFTVYYAQGLSYLSDDSRHCANCHIMRDHYDGWQKASHHAHASCNGCHTPHDFIGKYVCKAENGFWHSKGFTLQDFHEPIRIREKNSKILEHNCIDCHQGLVGDIAHADHAHEGENVETKWSCVHCHPQVGHGPPR